MVVTLLKGYIALIVISPKTQFRYSPFVNLTAVFKDPYIQQRIFILQN